MTFYGRDPSLTLRMTVLCHSEAVRPKNPGRRRTCSVSSPFYGRGPRVPDRASCSTDGVLRFSQDNRWRNTGGRRSLTRCAGYDDTASVIGDIRAEQAVEVFAQERVLGQRELRILRKERLRALLRAGKAAHVARVLQK